MLPTRERGFRPQASTFQFPVIIQTIHNRIAGNLHARENERIKDALNSTDPFLAITQVRIFDVHGERQLSTSDFLAINRANIIWVIENAAGGAVP
ncbi:MAG: hypothetical protein KF821_04835 [Anaerolineales bacterium]|jgi:hypothetical protein|nr:hypothetical protein [Anaerolineales bacterium]MCW5886967.1 hypothetical protein [Anaerolineales bacterium]